MTIARLCGIGTFLVCLFAGPALHAQGGGLVPRPGVTTFRHDIRTGAGVSRTGWLSDYSPSLAGSPGDSPVFTLDSGRPGATLLLVSGTHANEIAGIAASTMIVERARPKEGRIVVLPYANNSGSSWRDPVKPQSEWLAFRTPTGTRYLRNGSRFVHPVHQGLEDPAGYSPPGSAETLPGIESRNINRSYPGSQEGGLAQRVAFAIMKLIETEEVALAIDLHEATPSSALAWIIVCNPKNVDTGALAVLDLEDRGLRMRLDKSSETNHGLSHREWGDRTQALAFLVETPNPGQTTALPGDADQLDDPKLPLWKRVATQLEVISALTENFNSSRSGPGIRYDGLPAYAEFAARGIAAFF